MTEQPASSGNDQRDWFLTTRWTVVRNAGVKATEASRLALEHLCLAYWQPLYLYIRRKGFNEFDAQDLTQEFFVRLIARNDFAGLDPRHGRFRAFLLAALNHFIANEWRRSAALKRGGGQSPLSLDTTQAEQYCGSQLASDSSPERLFDRHWAETILERAARSLQKEFAASDKETQFRELNVFLSTPPASGDYLSLSGRLGLSEAAVAKAVERLRRRYRELVREEVKQTVGTSAELEEELRYLLELLA